MLKLLLKNFKLSDDIAFRFSNKGWPEYPLTAGKYVDWLNQIPEKEEVVNLFDRRNVRRVYTSTGQPDDDGTEVLNLNSATYDDEVVWHDLIVNDPQNYEPPRQIRVGFEFNF